MIQVILPLSAALAGNYKVGLTPRYEHEAASRFTPELKRKLYPRGTRVRGFMNAGNKLEGIVVKCPPNDLNIWVKWDDGITHQYNAFALEPVHEQKDMRFAARLPESTTKMFKPGTRVCIDVAFIPSAVPRSGTIKALKPLSNWVTVLWDDGEEENVPPSILSLSHEQKKMFGAKNIKHVRIPDALFQEGDLVALTDEVKKNSRIHNIADVYDTGLVLEVANSYPKAYKVEWTAKSDPTRKKIDWSYESVLEPKKKQLPMFAVNKQQRWVPGMRVVMKYSGPDAEGNHRPKDIGTITRRIKNNRIDHIEVKWDDGTVYSVSPTLLEPWTDQKGMFDATYDKNEQVRNTFHIGQRVSYTDEYINGFTLLKDLYREDPTYPRMGVVKDIATGKKPKIQVEWPEWRGSADINWVPASNLRPAEESHVAAKDIKGQNWEIGERVTYAADFLKRNQALANNIRLTGTWPWIGTIIDLKRNPRPGKPVYEALVKPGKYEARWIPVQFLEKYETQEKPMFAFLNSDVKVGTSSEFQKGVPVIYIGPGFLNYNPRLEGKVTKAEDEFGSVEVVWNNHPTVECPFKAERLKQPVSVQSGSLQLKNKQHQMFSSVKTAIALPDLVQQTNAFSVKYRGGCNARLTKSKPKELYLEYNVKCNKKDSDPAGHTVRVQFNTSKIEKDQKANSLDIQVSCSCPAFLYWGAQWNLHQRDGLLPPPRPELIAPTQRLDLRSNYVICKHCKAVFERILPSVQHNINNILRERDIKQKEEEEKQVPKEKPSIRRQPKEKAPLLKKPPTKEEILEQQGLVTREEPATLEEKKKHPLLTKQPKPAPGVPLEQPAVPEEEVVPTPEEEKALAPINKVPPRDLTKKQPVQQHQHPEGPHVDKGLPYTPKWKQYLKNLKDRVKSWGTNLFKPKEKK